MKNGISSPSINTEKLSLYVVSVMVPAAGKTVCAEARAKEKKVRILYI